MALALGIAEGWKLSRPEGEIVTQSGRPFDERESLWARTIRSIEFNEESDITRNLFEFGNADAMNRSAGSPPQAIPVTMPAPGPPDRLQLLGTIYDPSGASIAICILGANVPRTVTLGSRIGTFRVDSIQPGYIVITDSSAAAVVVRLRSRG
jgi:hypothetical protein